MPFRPESYSQTDENELKADYARYLALCLDMQLDAMLTDNPAESELLREASKSDPDLKRFFEEKNLIPPNAMIQEFRRY